MLYQQSNGSTTLPRGFRFHHQEGERPSTPEPTTNEPQQPSPPRPARLKVRRRNVSNLSAPTEHFLASVAAADIPIPTIEVPEVNEDAEMPDGEATPMTTSGFLVPQTYDFRVVASPKTPIPMLETSMDEDRSQRPDWSMGASSTSHDYFERPSSVLSNLSDCSDDSFYSGSRTSRPSDDGSCTSPESDIADPFQFASSKGNGKAPLAQNITAFNGKLRSKTRKDAPWTKAMSSHLWSIYLVYLQDPTVTPFRIGASSVPPEGVCYRVAREAKRSWKGPKLTSVTTPTLRRSSRVGSIGNTSRHTSSAENSGSVTPTDKTFPKTYAPWPHSSAATRSHLRELCKIRGSTPVQRHHHLQSRSPTPFTRSYIRPRDRLRTPESARLPSFTTKDIALSLTTSTAESMQPDGPLAKLTESDIESTTNQSRSFTYKLLGEPYTLGLGISVEDAAQSRRLGSPFIAHTYGPSSSTPLGTYEQSGSSQLRTQPDTVAATGPHLRSPLRFNKPRSLNNTQKRRAQHSLDEELSPSGAVLRPSILNEQLFGATIENHQRRVRSRGFSLGDDALRNRVPRLFQPPTIAVDPPTTSQNTTVTADLVAPSSLAAPALLPSATFDPPRLGSPFSESGPSNTFPRRLFQDGTATIRKNAFATMHQTRRSIESFDFGEGPSLQSRLSHLDQKLAEIRDREAAAH